MAEGSQLLASIASKQQELEGFEEDYQRTANQSAQVASTFGRLQSQQKDTDQPQIMEYIKLKHQVEQLHKEADDCRRKVEVTQTARGRSEAGRLRSSTAGHRAGFPMGAKQLF
eukprot:GHRR01035527.1.p1 GENE.GHRR01035527.1~~GHRR01035527.1.p1  ORF type:complete len:113 (+),score=38.27 GHRR01035527.1:362-700(+)